MRKKLEIGDTCKHGHVQTPATLLERRLEDGSTRTLCRVCMANQGRRLSGVPELTTTAEYMDALRKKANGRMPGPTIKYKPGFVGPQEQALDLDLDGSFHAPAW